MTYSAFSKGYHATNLNVLYIYVYTEAWTQTYCSYLFVYSGYLRLVLDDFTYVLVNSEALFLTSGITAATTT